MNYLYGDSTASQLESNVLELFRDALDCSVFLLQADAQIEQGRERVRALHEAADAELARLEAFIGDVEQAIREASAGIPESPTLACAGRLAAFTGEARQGAADAVREQLAREVATLEAEEASVRQSCRAALATLLLGQTPPDAKTVTRLVLAAGAQPAYEASLTGRAAFGLEWTFDLAIPEGNAWSAAVRVERFAPQLEIRAPQLAGWISKEVKVRPQKLDRLLVTELVDDGRTIELKLRAEGGTEAGFDLEVDCVDRVVTKVNRAAAKEDASVGPFDVHVEDVSALVELAQKLRSSREELTPLRLRSASFDDLAFHEQETFAVFVGRLVAMMAPILREISDRSLAPGELVLRRLLSNDRREEIFVAKSTLREKIAVLPEPVRLLFAPLGLDPVPPLPGSPTPTDRPPVGPSEASPPAPRAELAPSRPPPPMPSAGPPLRIGPLAPLGTVTVPSSPPPAEPDRAAPPEEATSRVLALALEKLANLAENGRLEEAYEDYGALFSDPAFAEYAPDDQRLALRQMLAVSAPSPSTDAVLDAHRAAILRAKALVEALGDPRDHEIVSLIKQVGAL